MPIVLLWNDAVSGSLAKFGRWFDSFEHSSLLLELWLNARVRGAERLESLTSRFPVFRFYNEAVTASVSRFQQGALLAGPTTGIGEHATRALSQWNVGRRVANVRREGRLLPELLRVLEEIVAGVLSSVERFQEPTPSMFDPTQRRAGDLPGLGALAFRAIGSSRDQILRAATGVRDALRPQAGSGAVAGTATTGADTSASAAASGALPLSFQLDGLTRYLVAGLLVLPALGRMVGKLGSDLLLHARHAVLDLFEQIETRAYDLRAGVLRLFAVDLALYARKGLVFLLAAKDVALDYLRFYSQVSISYLGGVVEGVSLFSDQMQRFWRGVGTVVHAAVTYGNAILNIDVGPQIHNALVAAEEGIETIDSHMYDILSSPQEYEAPDSFPVTVGELVMREGAGVRANRELVRASALVHAAWMGADPFAAAINRGLLHELFDMDIAMYIAAVRMLGQTLALPRAGLRAQPRLTLAAGSVPDLNALVIEPLATGLERSVANGARGMADGIGEVFAAADHTLMSASSAFSAAASAASRMGSVSLLNRLISDADALLGGLFGAPAEGEESRPTGLEPVAGSFAQWLIQGGFDTIGASLAGYVGVMLEAWSQELDENADLPVEITATSPRHLIERARLGRVHTTELRIRTNGEPLGRPLAERIADRFQTAIQAAYVDGQERMAQTLAATPAGSGG
ncbi:MAG: hypothetical protein AAF682_04015 [Planctomycetota bacterium]